MTQANEKYPHLSEVLAELEEFGVSFKTEPEIAAKQVSDKVYTFETHPFYSQIADYSDVEMNDD